MKYIIGLGTNIGSKKENLEKAAGAFSLVPKCCVKRISSVYETEPVGFEDQDSFYNAVIEVESSLSPNEMLGVCLGIEAGFGRVREIKNGPRILDLDIILAEGEKIESENLTVPHPRFKERRFVLIPLLELFPSGNAFGIEFSNCLLGIKGQGVKEVCKI